MPQIKDISGQRFGSLIAVSYSHLNKHKRAVWSVVCDCGSNHLADSNTLKRGLVTTCGCRGLNFTRRSVPLSERLASNITMEPNSGCWLWMGPCSENLYGRTSTGRGHGILTHRLVYEMHVGKIPRGMVLDHICKVTLCCNPAHLRPMGSHENWILGNHLVSKSHCKNGHLVTPENTLPKRGKQTYRCRACRDAAWQRDYARGRAKRAIAQAKALAKVAG